MSRSKRRLRSCRSLLPQRGRLHQVQLIYSAIFLFLVSDIGSNYFLVSSNCRGKIASGPEMLPDIIPTSSAILSGYVNRALSFDKTYYLGHRILRWYRDHHMDMIGHQVPLLDQTFSLSCQSMENFSQLFSYPAKNRFLPIFRYEDDVILTLPSGVV